jgi:hypothetical protein
MSFKKASSLIGVHFKETFLQILEAKIEALNSSDIEVEGFTYPITLENLLLDGKNGPIIIKSYDEQVKPRKSKDEVSDEASPLIKPIHPVNLSKEINIILEVIFTEVNEFIKNNKGAFMSGKNIIQTLSGIECEEGSFNIIAVLFNIVKIGKDEYSLKSYKEHEFLSFLDKNSTQKQNQREIIHLYTSFIISSTYSRLCSINSS